MHICKPSCLSQAGGAINEDYAAYGRDWLIVLDGSSGLTGRRYTSGQTDAAWFVGAVGTRLRRLLDGEASGSLPDLLRSVLAEVESEYRMHLKGTRVDSVDQPSASATLVRVIGEGLEYFVIGDCLMMVQTGTDLQQVDDTRVAHFDRAALAQYEKALAAGATPPDARASIQQTLVENRLHKNRSGGYWVLSPDPGCVAQGLVGMIPVRAGTQLLAMSDGFSALADQLHSFTDRKSLFEFLVHSGLEAAERILLSVTEADADCRRFPRFKKRDDYSCIIGRVCDCTRGPRDFCESAIK